MANQFQVQLGGSIAFSLRGTIVGFATDSTNCGRDECSGAVNRGELSGALARHTADANTTGTINLFGTKQLMLLGAMKQKKELL